MASISAAQCSSVMPLPVNTQIPAAPAFIDEMAASPISEGTKPEPSGSTTLSLFLQSWQMKSPL